MTISGPDLIAGYFTISVSLGLSAIPSLQETGSEMCIVRDPVSGRSGTRLQDTSKACAPSSTPSSGRAKGTWPKGTLEELRAPVKKVRLHSRTAVREKS